jgi:recombination protein RecT
MTTATETKEQKALQTAKKPESTIQELIQSPDCKRQFAIALPKHLKPDRFVRIALTAITKNPRLAECTKASLISCLLDLSALGLEPDGRRAHLIPYRNNANNTTICTLIVDYKGLVELAMNTKEVSNIHADVVCEKDRFVYNMGIVEKHEIDFTQDRGKMYAAYCIITMKDSTKKAEVMTKDEIDGIRARSRAKDAGPWVTDYNEMAKKTVFRRASKWIKLSPEVREKIEKTDEQEFDFTQQITDPIIGLRHDKNQKQQDPIDAEAKPAGSQEDPKDYLDFGDLARFGQDAKKAEAMINNAKTIASRIGKEKFLKVLGSKGFEKVSLIEKVTDLVALVNELPKEIEAEKK